MEITQKILLVVTIVGAINWGLIGLLDFDLVAYLFGTSTSFPPMYGTSTSGIFTVPSAC